MVYVKKKTRAAEMQMLKERAADLYFSSGLTMREVGKIVGKSHNWVAETLKELKENKGKKLSTE